MKLYKNILVTIDCSGTDEVIVDHILNLASIHKSKVNFIHIVHSHTLDQNSFMSDKAIACLEEIREKFQKKKIRVNVIIKSGEPEKEIIKVINEGDFDLIAMATHGHSHFLDLLYGSVSNALKHRTNIPILLIKSS